MQKLFILILIVLIVSCRKNASEFLFKGIWVEKTLQLDTIEFNPSYSSSTQSIYLSSQQTHLGYNYQVKTDSILLKSFGSAGGFSPYYFFVNSSHQFTISNFYQRSSLPPTIQFEKIK